MSNKIDDTTKQDFIDKLAKMSDEEIHDYIMKNGKNNANDKLFIFHWDRINPKNK